jgi:hypothetical protein
MPLISDLWTKILLRRHGKIPTLKISLIQIFRAHLWQKSGSCLLPPLLSLTPPFQFTRA